ncbi:MAG: aspartate--tRNA(Asn) ligase [Firmicutes bacterium]|nr:aspartate--tRNA(Asn) ligase [Bacillota bacterium]
MKRIYIEDLNKHFNEEVEICAFVDNIRNLQWVQFVILRDKTGKVQLTIEKSEESNSALVEMINNLSLESTVKVVGKVLENEKVKLNGMEIIPTKIEVTSKSLPELPLNIKDKNAAEIDTRLDYRFLDLRNEYNANIFKVQSEMVRLMREYLYSLDFTEIHTPKLIAAASESGSEVFEVKYFDRLAYLAQSPQFYKQMAMASGFERIFEVGPVFRAENSNTNRHTTEFTGFDLEFSYINSVEDVMCLEEEMLTYMLKGLNEKYGELVKNTFGSEIIVPTAKFPRIKLADLYKELEDRYGYVIDDAAKVDLTTEAEKLSYKYSMEVYNSEFLFVTDFPKDKRAFYHMRKDGIPQGYDLIWRGVEITTGAQREHRYEPLLEQALEKGLQKDVEFYLEFFKYGCPPHGGFGLGVDRITMLLLNLPSLKEAMFIFRGPNRLNP